MYFDGGVIKLFWFMKLLWLMSVPMLGYTASFQWSWSTYSVIAVTDWQRRSAWTTLGSPERSPSVPPSYRPSTQTTRRTLLSRGSLPRGVPMLASPVPSAARSAATTMTTDIKRPPWWRYYMIAGSSADTYHSPPILRDLRFKRIQYERKPCAPVTFVPPFYHCNV